MSPMGYNWATKDMENNKETQSRREFFKEAAKKALPILGAVALMSNPVLSKAAELESTGCESSCSGACKGGCTGCGASCGGACSGCTGSCYGSCTAASH